MKKKFKKIYIEISNLCNLSCSFCKKDNLPVYILSPEQLLYIIQQIKPFTDYVYLHVKGEPLIHPELSQILEICRNNSVFVNITTNGVLIKTNLQKLVESKTIREINFSLHCYNELPESKKQSYVYDILQCAESILESTNTIISLRLWNLEKDNQNNLKKQRNREILEQIENKFGLAYKIDEIFEPGKGIKIEKNLYLNFEREFIWPSLDNNYYNEKGFCHALRTHVAILADGTVAPCCLDSEGIIKLGNIFEIPFSEIINSQRANSIYEGFSQKIAFENLCKKCSFKEKFI